MNRPGIATILGTTYPDEDILYINYTSPFIDLTDKRFSLFHSICKPPSDVSQYRSPIVPSFCLLGLDQQCNPN